VKHTLHPVNAIRPTYGWVELKSGILVQSTTDAAGFDIIYPYDQPFKLYPYRLHKVPVGVVTQMAENMVGICKEKSGLALKGVELHGGVIDHHYADEWNAILRFVPPERTLFNWEEPIEPIVITKGMKVAQVIFVDLPQLTLIGEGFRLEEVRRTGGLGSTGSHV